MQKVLGFLIQFLFLSAASAGIFIASSLVAPIKAVVSQAPTQLPRMSIRFDEFSPAYAALEDDYYVGEYQEEKIPTNIAAQVLKPGIKEIHGEQAASFELPSLKISPSMINEPTSGNWKAPDTKSAVTMAQAMQQENAINALRIPHYWLDGKVELTQGLAITANFDQLRIGWFVDGQKQSDAKIDVMNGTYEIKVDRLEGEVVAEMVDSKGYMFGEAIVDLEMLAKQRVIAQVEVHNVDLDLAPYSFGFNGQTVSVYQTKGNRSPVPQTEVAIEGHDYHQPSDGGGKVHDESISNHSTAVFTASRGQYREAVVIADLEKEQTFRMFPEKFMGNFFDILHVDRKLRDLGVVWGTIRKDEVAAPGYRVRIAGHPEAKPVYFTYYIVDSKRQETSTDGEFSFVGMVDGDYEVEVVDGADKKIDSKLVAVRNGAVSLAEFDIGVRKTLYVRPFDPFTQTPKPLEFAAMGSDDIINAHTEDVLKLPVTQGADPVLIYTKSVNANIGSSTFASRSRKFQEVPVLNSAWWSGIQSQYKIDVAAGVVIGFIDTETNFQVFNQESAQPTHILYFNSQGQIVKNGERPAGFVIYGVGQGLKNLIIESDSGLLTTEAAFVENASISLFYKAL